MIGALCPLSAVGTAATRVAGGPLPFDEAGDVVSAYRLDGSPFAIVVVGLFVIVLLRAQATYWLGRGLAAGTIKAGFADALRRRLTSPAFARAVRLLHRWGPFAVTLCFLTIGVQTMVNLAAGLGRMPFGRYTLAMVPGCAAWAFIYATVGLTAFYSAVAAAAGSPWAIAVIAALILAAAPLAVRLHPRRAARRTAQVTTKPSVPPTGPRGGPQRPGAGPV